MKGTKRFIQLYIIIFMNQTNTYKTYMDKGVCIWIYMCVSVAVFKPLMLDIRME